MSCNVLPFFAFRIVGVILALDPATKIQIVKQARFNGFDPLHMVFFVWHVAKLKV